MNIKDVMIFCRTIKVYLAMTVDAKIVFILRFLEKLGMSRDVDQ